jgi:aerobic C4-dicarboxylate transport protein
VVISAWERELDRTKLARVMSGNRSESVPATPAA